MNKEEIDKILSRLERIDHKEYRCSFEFADSGSFKETCMCFDERKKLANHIKDLQQELNKKNKIIEETIDYVKYLKKNMGIDEYYLEKIYPEKYIDKILSKLEKGSADNDI